jgi:hypothetical protein
MEIANAVEAVQGRIHIEKIDGPFLFHDKARLDEYDGGLKRAIAVG